MKNCKNIKKYRSGSEDGGKPHDNAYPRGNPSSTGLSDLSSNISTMATLIAFLYY